PAAVPAAALHTDRTAVPVPRPARVPPLFCGTTPLLRCDVRSHRVDRDVGAPPGSHVVAVARATDPTDQFRRDAARSWSARRRAPAVGLPRTSSKSNLVVRRKFDQSRTRRWHGGQSKESAHPIRGAYVTWPGSR